MVMKKPALALEVEGDHHLEGPKSIADQTSEASCRKARVSIRARSDFSLV